MTLSPELQQESLFVPPLHQCLTSLPHHVIICLACSETSTHFILLLAFHGLGHGLRQDLYSPFLIIRENILSSPTRSEGMIV